VDSWRGVSTGRGFVAIRDLGADGSHQYAGVWPCLQDWSDHWRRKEKTRKCPPSRPFVHKASCNAAWSRINLQHLPFDRGERVLKWAGLGSLSVVGLARVQSQTQLVESPTHAIRLHQFALYFRPTFNLSTWVLGSYFVSWLVLVKHSEICRVRAENEC
jgi:hypothetical protein